MAILRYTASADTTITNAFQADLVTRGTGSNMGYADSLEVFSIYGQTSGSVLGRSQELSRMLIKFPVSKIIADRAATTIPASGSVSFYLRMFNAETPFTLPQDFTLTVAPVSRSWNEGTGLDMDEYKDLGFANWISASSTTGWTSIGGDYLTSSNYNATFAQGYEDLEVDITHLVERWVKGSSGGGIDNYGVGIHLTASQEAYHSSSTGADSGSVINNLVGSTDSYYTKKFFARSTEYFFSRPLIEARWDSRLMDDRENFYFSSSRAEGPENLNSLYFYNYVRGRLRELPVVGSDPIYVSFYSSSAGLPTGSKLTLAAGAGVVAPDYLNATGSSTATGLWQCQIALTAAATPLEAIHDVWHNLDHSIEYFTGSVYPELLPTFSSAPTFTRVTSCRNLKPSYSQQDKSRFRFFVRSRDWSPTVYVKATANNPTEVIASASYAVYRTTDNYAAIPYGTGSNFSTFMSYDEQGNYFDLDMSLLESGYMYEIKLSYYNDSIGDWQEQPQTFKFRVDE